ncbi:MAG: HAD-IIIC family phosphatase [Gammaproteobacteria bacterium]|nr:HAD-IIIC family phosphatase [Gammaproteobacteria bacterium]
MKTLQQLHETILQTNIATLLSSNQQSEYKDSTKPFSIYFLSNFTVNQIEHILSFYLRESNMVPTVVFGQYDNAMQELLDNNSLLYRQNYDAIVCALMYNPFEPTFIDRLKDVTSFIAELKTLFDLANQKTSALILINTICLPLYSENGITTIAQSDRTDACLAINTFIRSYTHEHAGRFFLLDWGRYVSILGEAQSFDYRYWQMYEAPFKKAFLSLYASDITKIARALHGDAKKCLILDCDNTLWGGIVGEDGLNHIQLDPHVYPGRIFYQFQQTVLELIRRGVIIALCSKNNENEVWNVLDHHPYSLLRRSHVAATQINWDDKANNIVKIITTLNIGIESCVFVDDSPTECELVTHAIPELTVIRVPQRIYEFPLLLLKEGLFDTLAISQADGDRNVQYQTETKRKQLLTQVHNISDYLAALELKAMIGPVVDHDIMRVTQLTQKTNQFNLSTRRYTQQQIESLQKSKESAVYSLKVEDKFGDYGLTGVLIARRDGEKGIIDSFLMSCRILSRHIEYVFLEHCMNQLSKLWNIHLWEAEYLKSDKNQQMKTFLEKAGFYHVREEIYTLNTQNWTGYNINHILVKEVSYA